MNPPSDLELLLGEPVASTRTLGGGCVGDVALVTLVTGRRVVVKRGGPEIDAEARSLRALAERSDLPVPRVLAEAPGVFAMDFVETDSSGTRDEVERDAAEKLAALHRVTSDRGFGFDFDTVIGGLPQPNAWSDDWSSFYAERRVLHMTNLARDAGRIDAGFTKRIEALVRRFDDLLAGVDAPALVHGDVWSGNVLTRGGRVAAFIDPAVSYADREIELAFITMFGTFGDAFFGRYHELFPIREGFWESRRDLYVLYPTLVHVRLFGGGYVGSAEVILRRFA